MILPVNAQAILDARMKGFKPADMVVVSLVGAVGLDNPTVFAKPDVRYDWRWVRGLDVCLYLRDEPDWSTIAKDIAVQHPEHMNLWHADHQWGATVFAIPAEKDIARPPRSWKYELDFSIWLDFQNRDFINGTTYTRINGVPHAVNH